MDCLPLWITCLLVLLVVLPGRCVVEVNGCVESEYGCCPDGVTSINNNDTSRCPQVDVCLLPPAAGSCDDSMTRYYYNPDEETCTSFVYGGCGGNSNRFLTIDECQMACAYTGHLIYSNGGDSRSVGVGNDIELYCELPQVPHTFSWKFVPADERQAQQPPVSSRFEIALDHEKSTLSIRGIRPEDAGTYICEAILTESGKTTSNHVVIEVRAGARSIGAYQKEEGSSTLSTLVSSDSYSASSALFIEESTTTVVTESTDASTGSTPSFLIEGEELKLESPPTNVETRVIGGAISDGSVEIFISWSPPRKGAVVDLYTIYISTNKSLPLAQWSSSDVMETSILTRLKTHPPTYIQVQAINSISRSPLSAMEVFNLDQVEQTSTTPLQDSSNTTPYLTEKTTPYPAEKTTPNLTEKATPYTAEKTTPYPTEKTTPYPTEKTASVTSTEMSLNLDNTNQPTTPMINKPQMATSHPATATYSKQQTPVNQPIAVDSNKQQTSKDLSIEQTSNSRQSTTAGPATTQSTTVQPATTQQIMTRPTTTQLTVTQPSTTRQIMTQPTPQSITLNTTQPTVTRPTATQPATARSSYSLSTTAKAITSTRTVVTSSVISSKAIPALTTVAKVDANSESCEESQFGCCDDGITPAKEENKEGCLKTEESMAIVTPPIKPPVPNNFQIERTLVAADRVGIHLSWEKPSSDEMTGNMVIAAYTISFTDELTSPNWRTFTLTDTEYALALRSGYVYYFTITSVSSTGVESELSPLYKYDPQDLRAIKCADGDCSVRLPCRLSTFGCCNDGISEATGLNKLGCPDASDSGRCASSRWRCCGDGVTPAAGPENLGCPGEPQPCDISWHGCCPDGKTMAEGERFESCAETIELPPHSRNRYELNCSTDTSGGKQCQDQHFKALAESCSLPRETGSCGNYSINWYYDLSSGSCRRFWYGGCQGNTNRFSSREHCESFCVHPPGTAACYLPAVKGRCESLSTKWHYDSEAKTCGEFEYGGCAGNSNNFNSRADCLQFCQQTASTQTDVCNQPKVEGPCRGAFIRWWYNRRSGACESFTYSGCFGSENRFVSQEDCDNRCVDTDQTDTCALAKDTGPCFSLIPSWYYDFTSKTCSPFYYGGCGGNKNRFSSEQACQQECQPDGSSDSGVTTKTAGWCSLTQDPGQCLSYIPRWYYDSVRDVCRLFIYGGCGGNKNRFITEEACIETCTTSSSIEDNQEAEEKEERSNDDVYRCALPRDRGDLDCSDNLTRWFYDRREGSCQQYIYSGCSGNDNRFTTKEECDSVCSVANVCSLPEVRGSCSQQVEMYRYDSQSLQCVRFVYSGCDGNANRFETRAMCEVACQRYLVKPAIETNVVSLGGGRLACNQPVVRGTCSARILSYFYDRRLRVCREFVYSGCDGNDNRFSTPSACRAQCMDESDSDNEMKARCRQNEVCYNACPDGFVKDRFGCVTCKCIDLCQSVVCSEPNTRCVVKREVCGATLPDESNIACVPTAQPVCIVNSAAQEVAPYITRPDGVGSQFVRNAGVSAVLPCNADGFPKPNVVWYKDRKPLEISEASRYSVEADDSLRIANLQVADGGEYICRAFNNVGEPAYEYLTLTVHQGVSIKDGPTEFLGPRGSSLTIQCDVTGTPKPRIAWIFRGGLVPSGDGDKYTLGEDNSLTVHNVSADDVGDYVCIAKNSISSASKTLTLKIKEPLAAYLQNHVTAYAEGETLSLVCATQGFPAAKVEWLRNDETLPYESRISITANALEISALTEEDSGFYTCVATNEHEALTVTTTIEVEEAAPVITKTVTVLPLSCQDKPELANCKLIVQYGFCSHPIYRNICCKSCVLSGRLRL